MQDRPEKVVEINWKDKAKTAYRLKLTITAEDQPGLLNNIANLISQMQLSILSLHSHVNEMDNTAHFTVTVMLKKNETAKKIDSALRAS